MGELYVVVEHRRGEVRAITYEMLFKGSELCARAGHTLTAVLLSSGEEGFSERVACRADRVLAFADERLRHYDPCLYKAVLDGLIRQHRPFLTLMGHTSWGMGYAPALSVKAGYPLATDCVDIALKDGALRVTRQMYGGKVYSKVSFREAEGYLATVRSGAFPPPEGAGERNGEIVRMPLPPDLPERCMEFVEYVDTGAGDVDIAQADLLVSIGRGVGEEENIAVVRELADWMGGALSCSRPVVDKNWLPKYHQVGTSGKSVRPKVYLALGISGAFQHVAGIAGAQTVIAVNKDRKAPIFRVSDYGIVGDLFDVVDALKRRIGG
jgi:electron transfer flavoprotein alpha subunit